MRFGACENATCATHLLAQCSKTSRWILDEGAPSRPDDGCKPTLEHTLCRTEGGSCLAVTRAVQKLCRRAYDVDFAQKNP